MQQSHPEAALKEAEVIVKTNYKTHFVEHAYLELNRYRKMSPMRDEVTVYGSMQAPYNADIHHRMLNILMSQIIFKPSTAGGSFMAKSNVEANAIRVTDRASNQTTRPSHLT